MTLTPLQRKARLIEAGHSLTDIAESLELSVPHVSQVVAGERRSTTVEAEVARRLKMKPREVFPARG